MPQRAWSDKRERQYDHIKEGLLERGDSERPGRGDRRPNRQQGASPRRRGEGVEPHVDRRHLVVAARRPALPWRTARTHPRPALPGGQGQGHSRTLLDEQAPARRSGRGAIARERRADHACRSLPRATPVVASGRDVRTTMDETDQPAAASQPLSISITAAHQLADARATLPRLAQGERPRRAGRRDPARQRRGTLQRARARTNSDHPPPRVGRQHVAPHRAGLRLVACVGRSAGPRPDPWPRDPDHDGAD